MRIRDASFARSFDPRSSILTMHRRVKPAVVGRSRRHRGWANLRKQEEPAPGSSRRTERISPRITARKGGVVRKKRKAVEAVVPARTESSGLVARTSECSCRSH